MTINDVTTWPLEHFVNASAFAENYFLVVLAPKCSIIEHMDGRDFYVINSEVLKIEVVVILRNTSES